MKMWANRGERALRSASVCVYGFLFSIPINMLVMWDYRSNRAPCECVWGKCVIRVLARAFRICSWTRTHTHHSMMKLFYTKMCVCAYSMLSGHFAKANKRQNHATNGDAMCRVVCVYLQTVSTNTTRRSPKNRLAYTVSRCVLRVFLWFHRIAVASLSRTLFVVGRAQQNYISFLVVYIFIWLLIVTTEFFSDSFFRI